MDSPHHHHLHTVTTGTRTHLRTLSFDHTHTPPGVVRGINMDRGLFYLTSPECTSIPSLTRVNVIALGNPDQLDFFSVQEVYNSS